MHDHRVESRRRFQPCAPVEPFRADTAMGSPRAKVIWAAAARPENREDPLVNKKLICVLSFVLFSAFLMSCTDDAAKPEVGHPAPDFRLTSVDGVPVRLRDLEGKVVFVNLWATWCPPCRQEMPSMVELYKQFRDDGLEILAISQDRDSAEVKRFMNRFQIPFPVLMDQNKMVYNLYRATGVPETHLIDKDGMIRFSRIGPFDWTSPDIVSTVRALLGG